MHNLIEDDIPVEQAPKPAQWSWIVQRAETDGKAASIWKLGFIAPDGGQVRVTFHEVGKSQPPAQQPDPMTGQPVQSIVPPGQPDTAQTENATFYVTFFSSRNPEHFTKWDTSLSHEDSMSTWITITHGLVDFIRKAKPSNLVLDDLANGKLKMVLRSVSMDVAAANPDYELEITKKHEYRGFYQIRKTGTPSAFQTAANGGAGGETANPGQPYPVAGTDSDSAPAQNSPETGIASPQTPPTAQPDPQVPPPTPEASVAPVVASQPMAKRGMSVEIGRDYSIAVKDATGLPVDRYKAKNPADILRWINKKGYGAVKMKIVDAEQPSGQIEKNRAESSAPVAQQQNQPQKNVREQFIVQGNVVRVPLIGAAQAASMNAIVSAQTVRCTSEGVEFVFESTKDMNFKKALVELAYVKTTSGPTN